MPKPEQLVRDQSAAPIQIGSSFTTTDGTNDSPLSYSSTIIPISVPNGAVEFIIAPSSDLRISEESTMTTYDIVVGGSKEAIGCARMSSLYIARDSADGTAVFRFTKV